MTLAEIDSTTLFWMVLMGGVGAVVIVWIVAATIDSIAKTRAREQTTREIAAYIAEGSISVTDGKALIALAQQGDIAKQFADWHFNQEKAVEMIRALKDGSDPLPAAPESRPAATT